MSLKVDVRHDGDAYTLHSPYDAKLVAVYKTIPGLTWNPIAKVWRGYSDAVELAKTKATCVTFNTGNPPIGAPHHAVWQSPYAALRAYQMAGVRHLLHGTERILADDMGTGKTATTIHAINTLSVRAIVVCPNYVKGVWADEWAKWAPDAVVQMAAGTKTPAVDTGAQVMVLNYDILHAWADVLATWLADNGVVVFDEGHALCNEKSRRSQAAKAVAKAAHYRWALTGTPLTNRPRDLWNVVDTISPGRFGSFFAFAKRYCAAHQQQVTPTKHVWNFDGSSNLEELHARCRHFMLRRLKSEVMSELPPKTRQPVYIDVAKGQKLVSLNPREMRQYLNAAADAKLPDAIEVIAAHAKEERKVVVGCYRKSIVEYIATALRAVGVDAYFYHGDVDADKRKLAVEAAKNSATGSVLLATFDTSSEGVDFSFADVAVAAELVWKPHQLLQWESRLHRFGQQSAVLVQYVIARGTSDEFVLDAVLNKLGSFETVTGSTGEDMRGTLLESEDEVLAQMAAAIGNMGR